MKNRKRIERSKSIRNMRIAGRALSLSGVAYALLLIFIYQAFLGPKKDMDPQIVLLLTAAAVVANFLFNYVAQRWVGATIAFPVHLEQAAGRIEG